MPGRFGRVRPAHCDLILPIEPDPLAVECNYIAALAGQADPICAAYVAREEARAARLRAAMECLEPSKAPENCLEQLRSR